MDALKLAQLSGIFAGLGQSQATFNPAQRSLTDYLQGSAQSAIQAEAQKKAEKKAKKKSSGLGSILGAGASIAAAPFTGGASLAYLPAAMSAGGAIDSAVSGDIGGAVANTANAVGSPFGVGSSYSAGPLPRATTPTAPSPYTNLTSSGSTLDTVKSMQKGGPGRAEVASNMDLRGSAANRSQALQIVGMSPRELRRFANSDPAAEQAILEYLNSGGSLSSKQLRGLPVDTKQALRYNGYGVPGPFGIATV